MNGAKIAIIMGSDSDLGTMSDAAKLFEELHVPYDINILSTHRTPDETSNFAKKAKAQGFKVIIAAAGGAAALPGSIASLTTLPVIGVPIKSSSLDGLDSLLSMVQMPPGVPVATVAINGAKNAAILALEIIALSDNIIAIKLQKYREDMEKGIKNKSKLLKEQGYKKYLLNK